MALEPGHYILTETELLDAVERVLERLGCSYAELEAEALTNDFTTIQRRFAWVAIGGIDDMAERLEARRARGEGSGG